MFLKHHRYQYRHGNDQGLKPAIPAIGRARNDDTENNNQGAEEDDSQQEPDSIGVEVEVSRDGKLRLRAEAKERSPAKQHEDQDQNTCLIEAGRRPAPDATNHALEAVSRINIELASGRKSQIGVVPNPEQVWRQD